MTMQLSEDNAVHQMEVEKEKPGKKEKKGPNVTEEEEKKKQKNVLDEDVKNKIKKYNI